MITLITKVIIKHKSPQQVFDFLLNLNTQRYIQMCPKAYKEFAIIKANKNVIGSVYYFHEIVGNLDLHKNWIVTDARKNEYLSQKALWFYPVNLQITLKKLSEGTELTHALHIGFQFLGIEKIIDRFGRTFFLTKKQMQILENHAVEEFTSLESLID